MTASDVARMIENTEAAAYADQLRAAPSEWKCCVEESEDGWFLLAPTLDMLLFNRLVAWGLDAPARREQLESSLARYRASGVHNFGVQLSPEARPAGFAGWLEEYGLQRADNWTKVYRGTSAVPSIETDLRVEQIDRRNADDFATVACTAFAMPRALAPWIGSIVGRPAWNHYIAWNGNEPVGAAALFVRGDVGWLGVAGTLPSARRRGAQSALMARRLTDGIDLGCRWFVTETGQDTPQRPNPSFHNMLRLGFSVAYNRPNYLAR